MIPNLATKENYDLYYFKLLRYFHYNRLLKSLDWLLDKILFSRGFNKNKIKDYVELIKILVLIMFGMHGLTCFWIYLGRRSRWEIMEGKELSDENLSWVYRTENAIEAHNYLQIYITGAYYILQVIATVGYGDMKYGTSNEYLFAMILEVTGMTYFSIMLSKISAMYKKKSGF